jgi:hypothetical protein
MDKRRWGDDLVTGVRGNRWDARWGGLDSLRRDFVGRGGKEVSMKAKGLWLLSFIVTVPTLGSDFPTSFEPAVPVPGLEGLPVRVNYVMRDGSTMVLYDAGDQKMKKSSWDPEAERWTPPQEMGFPMWAGFATFSPDEKAMYYGNHDTIYVDLNGDPSDDQEVVELRGVQAGVSIGGDRAYFGKSWLDYTDIAYASYDASDPLHGFGPVTLLSEIDTPDFAESYPYVTLEHEVLLFARYSPEAPSLADIWKATWNGSRWCDPAPLGPEINTVQFSEAHPVYCPGTGILYFARDVPGPMQARGRPAEEPCASAWTNDPAFALPMVLQAFGVACTTDGVVVLVGGGQTGLPFSKIYTLDESTGDWNPVADLPHGIGFPAVAPDTIGRVWIFGGSIPAESSTEMSSEVWIYDPRDNSVTPGNPLPSALNAAKAVLLPDGDFLVLGGIDESLQEVSTVFRYDHGSRLWSEESPMLMGRCVFGAAVGLDGSVIAVGGAQSGAGTAEVRDPATGLWRFASPPLVHPWQIGAATADSCGRAWVAGGWNPHYAIADVEYYDFATDTWTVCSPLNVARNILGLVQGASGRLYAIGGGGAGWQTDAVEYIHGCVTPPPAEIALQRASSPNTISVRVRAGEAFKAGSLMLQATAAISGLKALPGPDLPGPDARIIIGAECYDDAGDPVPGGYMVAWINGKDRSLPPGGPYEVLVIKLELSSGVREGDPVSLTFLDGLRGGPDSPMQTNIVTTSDNQSVRASTQGAALTIGSYFQRGDANRDGGYDLSDAVTIFSHLFLDGQDSACPDAEDVNDDGDRDISDPVRILMYLFLRGTAPPSPHPGWGLDPTPDSLPPCPSLSAY